MTAACCACPACVAMVRDAILAAFEHRRAWTGPFMIRYIARLGWVPIGLYKEILDGMRADGTLLFSYSPEHDESPRYLPSHLMGRPAGNSSNFSNSRRPQGVEGGGHDA